MILEGYKSFLDLRRYVMDEIGKVDFSNGCKINEGLFELKLSYPDYFDEGDVENGIDKPDVVIIRLYCYVLGPRRVYEWKGKTILEAVKKARKEIKSWG